MGSDCYFMEIFFKSCTKWFVNRFTTTVVLLLIFEVHMKPDIQDLKKLSLLFYIYNFKINRYFHNLFFTNKFIFKSIYCN